MQLLGSSLYFLVSGSSLPFWLGYGVRLFHHYTFGTSLFHTSSSPTIATVLSATVSVSSVFFLPSRCLLWCTAVFSVQVALNGLLGNGNPIRTRLALGFDGTIGCQVAVLSFVAMPVESVVNWKISTGALNCGLDGAP
jgi:hypothetical protein